jgi:hypothetical protein
MQRMKIVKTGGTMRTIFMIALFIASSLYGYYPQHFFGADVDVPVTEYEDFFVSVFGTYHGETRHLYELERINAFEPSFQPIRKKRFTGSSGNNFELVFQNGACYNYDSDNKIISKCAIDENNNIGETLCEYTYFNSHLQFTQVSDDLVYSYHYHGASTSYEDEQGNLSGYMLITYIFNQDELTCGWVGRNYDLNSEYYAAAYFDYNEDEHLIYFRYETPTSKESVFYQSHLIWNDDQLTEVNFDSYQTHYLNYSGDGKILEIVIYDTYSGEIAYRYHYDYDEFGRLIGETEEYYCNGNLSSIGYFEYDYEEYQTEAESEFPAHSIHDIKNYPNPFNPETKISYQLSDDSIVKIEIINAKGQLIETIIDEKQKKGKHSVVWNAEKQASGIYFYKISSKAQTFTGKALLLK